MSVRPSGPVSRGLLAAVVTLGLFVLACGSPWKVITASGPPSALKGDKSFAVAVTYDGVSIGNKTEAAYLADKDAETQGKFQGDKKGMEEELMAVLGKNKGGYSFGASGDVAVNVAVTMIEPGVYTAVYNMPTTVLARVTFTKGGNAVDIIEVTTTQNADIYHPSSGQRMRNCAEQLGTRIVQFLDKANK